LRLADQKKKSQGDDSWKTDRARHDGKLKNKGSVKKNNKKVKIITGTG